MEFNERIHLREQGVVTETQCDLGTDIAIENHRLGDKMFAQDYLELSPKKSSFKASVCFQD